MTEHVDVKTKERKLIDFVDSLHVLMSFKYRRPWIASICNFANEERSTTVIIGAGVIGLCTAYQLGKAIDKRRLHSQQKVVVVEAAADIFSASSSTNTGILSSSGFKDELSGLARYSYGLWEKQAGTNADFRDTCGYKEGRNIAVCSETDRGRQLLPNWVEVEPAYVQKCRISADRRN